MEERVMVILRKGIDTAIDHGVITTLILPDEISAGEAFRLYFKGKPDVFIDNFMFVISVPQRVVSKTVYMIE